MTIHNSFRANLHLELPFLAEQSSGNLDLEQPSPRKNDFALLCSSVEERSKSHHGYDFQNLTSFFMDLNLRKVSSLVGSRSRTIDLIIDLISVDKLRIESFELR